jgi:N-acetylglucosaminyl-diphospho-decaprenol L-rhamnosyltransferase
MNRIGVVIVTYNSEAHIGRCLDSLPPGLPLVVVDNASSDRTRAQVLRRPRAQLLANEWNRGFAAAANQGFDTLDCGCVLLMNPDVEVIGDIDLLADECEKEGIAAVTGKLLGRDGRPQLGFMVRRFPTPAALAFEILGINRLLPGNPANRSYRCSDLDIDIASDVEQPAGAFLLVRRGVWRKLGGFDESFHPVWFEDVDFLKRAAMAGCVSRYLPVAMARHEGGHSVGRVPAAAAAMYWYGNLLAYAARHFPRTGVLAVCVALMLGSVLRASFGVVRSLSLKPVSIYARVFCLAVTYLFAGRMEAPDLSSAFATR